MKTAIFVSALILATTANAGGRFKYSIYKLDIGNDKFVKNYSSNIPPRRINQQVMPPGYYSVPQNASSQYAPWHRSLSIKAPSNNGGRGGPCHKCPVVK